MSHRDPPFAGQELLHQGFLLGAEFFDLGFCVVDLFVCDQQKLGDAVLFVDSGSHQTKFVELGLVQSLALHRLIHIGEKIGDMEQLE